MVITSIPPTHPSVRHLDHPTHLSVHPLGHPTHLLVHPLGHPTHLSIHPLGHLTPLPWNTFPSLHFRAILLARHSPSGFRLVIHNLWDCYILRTLLHMPNACHHYLYISHYRIYHFVMVLRHHSYLCILCSGDDLSYKPYAQSLAVGQLIPRQVL
jgi:hypothetical protein